MPIDLTAARRDFDAIQRTNFQTQNIELWFFEHAGKLLHYAENHATADETHRLTESLRKIRQYARDATTVDGDDFMDVMFNISSWCTEALCD